MNSSDEQMRITSAFRAVNRQTFLRSAAASLGMGALAGLDSRIGRAQESGSKVLAQEGVAGGQGAPAAKAKRIIYLFQSGAPSQMDLFDWKPELAQRRGENLPDSIRQGQRLTTMTSGQSTFPVAPTAFRFDQHGKSGMWFSEIMPHMASLADDWCQIRSMHTEAINHDPAITFCQTGSQLAGRPSIGSWISYGLGSENQDLPAYVVLTSFGVFAIEASGGQVPQSWGCRVVFVKSQGDRCAAPPQDA